MSFIYSQALVAAYSEANCLDTDASAQLSESHTPKPSWLHDKTMEPSRHSRFGMTYAPLTESHGAELLMWFAADSLAKTSATADTRQESKEAEADYGIRWRGSFAKYDRDTYSWRTWQRCLIEEWASFSETWPRSGLMLDGVCWEQQTLVESSQGSEFGYWPTLKASDGDQYSSNLDYFKRRKEIAPDLPVIVALNTPPTDQGHFGKINPEWCEWLMGWPIGWTELGLPATDKTRV